MQDFGRRAARGTARSRISQAPSTSIFSGFGTGNAVQQIQKTNRSIERGTNLLRLYATAWIGVSAVLTTLREIGIVQNLERAIGTVTSSSQELNSTWERLQQLSLATRSDFEANVVLFQRLRFSTENLGASTEITTARILHPGSAC